MKSYPKVRRIGHPETNGILSGDGPLTIKEKLDGANMRFTVNEDRNGLLFGSRNVEWKNERDTDKAFRHAVKYVRETLGKSPEDRVGSIEFNLSWCDIYDGLDDLVFFGEAMHPHTLEYADTSGTEIGWKGLPSFIGFDVWYNGEFLRTENAKTVFEELGLPFTNVVDTCDPSNFMDDYGAEYVPDSAYYDGKAEGVVLTNENNRLKAKLVSEEFAEKHGSVNSGVKENPSDTINVVETYCTDARIRKQVHKLQDEGHTIERAMMSELPVRVARDILEEEAHEFVTSNWTVDFKEFRSEVGQSSSLQTDCLSVIDDMMVESMNGSQEATA